MEKDPIPIVHLRQKIDNAIESFDLEDSSDVLVQIATQTPLWFNEHLKLQHSVPSPSCILECLHPKTLIFTNEGTITIGAVVNKGRGDRVLTLLDNGEFGWKKIIKRYRSPLLNRQLLEVKLQHGKQHGKSTPKAVVTNDHLFLTATEGWVRADCLKTDTLVVSGQTEPNIYQMSIIDGSLLGDGSYSSRGQFSVSHVHHSYGMMKGKALDSLNPTHYLHHHHSSFTNTKPQLVTYLPIRIWSRQQRERWYPNGKKVVPKDISITDELLAVWYMDDGCLVKRSGGAKLATHGFTKEDVEFLKNKLSIFLRAEVRIHTTKNKNKVYYFIYLPRKTTEVLMKKIGSFVPDELRYKVYSYASVFILEKWEIPQELGVNIDYPIVSLYEGSSNNFVYCIDVEDTHNFVTHGGVVHNCRYKLWCRGRGIEEDTRTIPIYWKIRAAAGIITESYWLAVLSQVGFDVTAPNESFQCGPHMRAHPDGILDKQFSLEIKSESGFGYKKLIEHPAGVVGESPDHYAQVQLNLYATGMDYGLYLNSPPDPGMVQSQMRQTKKYGPEYMMPAYYVEFIRKNDNEIERLLERAELIVNDIANDDPPEREYSGEKYTSRGTLMFPCGYCGFRENCVAQWGSRAADIKYV